MVERKGGGRYPYTVRKKGRKKLCMLHFTKEKRRRNRNPRNVTPANEDKM